MTTYMPVVPWIKQNCIIQIEKGFAEKVLKFHFKTYTRIASRVSVDLPDEMFVLSAPTIASCVINIVCKSDMLQPFVSVKAINICTITQPSPDRFIANA